MIIFTYEYPKLTPTSDVEATFDQWLEVCLKVGNVSLAQKDWVNARKWEINAKYPVPLRL